MTSLPQAPLGQFRRRLSSWRDGLVFALVFLAAIWLYADGGRLARSSQVILWLALALAAAVLLRSGWLKLFGPVLFYDLIRIARRGRYALLRCLYAVFLLLMLLAIYRIAYANRPESGPMDAKQLASLGEVFFSAFIGVQYFAVCLLTPAFTAGAIAEDKERRTLEFVLTTDLHDREVVLGKQTARLANLALLVLAGLPILSMMQFLGGVDPDFLIAAFAATGLTMLGLGSLSILCSVYARKVRNAILLTYLTMAAYLAVSCTAKFLLLVDPRLGGYALGFWEDPPTVQGLVDAFSVANPLVTWARFVMALQSQSSLSDFLIEVLGEYAAFFGVVTLGCTTLAVLRLRPVSLRQTFGSTKPVGRKVHRKAAPYRGVRPMVWKETVLEPSLQLNWFGRIVLCALVGVSFIPPAWMLVDYFGNPRSAGFLNFWNDSFWKQWQEGVNIWARVAGSGVACLLLLGVAVRASASVSGERERQTLDSLLTTTLDADEMLWGKWLGSIWSVRWGWAWLGLIWGFAVLVGGLSPLAVPCLMVAWLVFAAVLAGLGLWLSALCRTTLRANVSTLLVTAGLAFGHWLPWMTCCIPAMITQGSGDAFKHFALFQAFGLSPPVTLGYLGFYDQDWSDQSAEWRIEIPRDVVIGLVCWALLAFLFWVKGNGQFARSTGRLAAPRPLAPLQPGDKVAVT
jgi:ABC-type transport system involved in multi-copper enzyme maturation permease subunit